MPEDRRWKTRKYRRANRQRSRQPVTPPDQQDRQHQAQESNYQRGAAPTGGPGRKEARRAKTVVRSVEKGRASPREVQRHLQRQGFEIAVDGVWGPQTQDAWKRYLGGLATGQQKHEAERYRRQKEYLDQKRYLNPSPDRRLEKDLFGEDGLEELQRLRQQFTQDRFADYANQTNPDAKKDDGLLDAVRDIPGKMADTYKSAGKSVGRELAEGITGQPDYLAGLGRRIGEDFRSPLKSVREDIPAANELLVGSNLMKAIRGEEFDPKWAAVEAALLPVGIGKPFKAAARVFRGGKRGTASSSPKPQAEVPPKPSATKVRESLGPARRLRAEQARGYSEERSRRVAKAQQAAEQAGGGIAGHKAALAELRGELPKVKFEKLRAGNLTEPELEQLFHTVDQHSELRFFDKVSTKQALTKAFYEGTTPTPSEIRHLQTVFGQEAVKVSAAKWKVAGSVANIPRSLMSTLDLSGTLRQGLVVAVAHPKIVARNMKPQIKALVSEKNHAAIMDEIHARPNAERYKRSGLPLTTLDDITTREEQFSSGLAETLTGGKRFSPVRASGRAYTGFLNKTRADVFDLLDDLARAQGHNVENLKFERDLARLIGSMTGRGPLPQSLKGAATFLNATFFSPRLMAGRIDLLFAPITYAKADPFVRKQALKSMLRLYAAGGAILTLAAAAGGKVNLDPRNADFAKVRISNTRIDIFGGFQQYVRLLAQVASGTIVSSATGKKLTLGAEFGELSRKDIIERFGVGKFAPPTSFVYDFFKGTDYEGEPFNIKKAALQRLIPFIAQDLHDLYRETGSIPASVGGAGLIGFGIGVQTYSNRRVVERRVDKVVKDLTRDSEEAGLGRPPDAVIEDARWRSELDSRLEDGMSSTEKARIVAEVYDERYGVNHMRPYASRIKSKPQAQQFYEQVRSRIYPYYSRWDNAVDRVLDARVEAAG